MKALGPSPTFALADKVAGDRHRGPFVGDFGMFGDDFSDHAGGIEEDPCSGTEMWVGHFAKCGTGGELKSSKLASLNKLGGEDCICTYRISVSTDRRARRNSRRLPTSGCPIGPGGRRHCFLLNIVPM